MTTTTTPKAITDHLGAQAAARGSLLPPEGTPFYVITPAYSRISAGVKVLHALCHYLNLLGERAFLVPYPAELVGDPAWPHWLQRAKVPMDSAALNTPVLTRDLAEYHHRRGLTPVTVVPEVYDDPISAPFIARYNLNYPGALAPRYHTPHHYMTSYGRRLAQAVGSPNVLYLPMVDLDFFRDDGLPRQGSCFYAGKYKDIHRGDLSVLPKGSREILRASQMSRETVREILNRSEVFYCFEDTALGVEAILCGCPTVFIPNAHFKGGAINSHELGNHGMAWGTSKKEVARARRTVHLLRPTVERYYRQAPEAIARFAAEVKALARGTPYPEPVRLPYDVRQAFLVPHDGSHDLREW